MPRVPRSGDAHALFKGVRAASPQANAASNIPPPLDCRRRPGLDTTTRPGHSRRIHMQRACLIAAVGLLAAALFVLPSVAREDDSRATAPEGFVSLFNGKDLVGWKVPAGD